MANTHEVLAGVKEYTLELLGEEYRDVAVDAADRAEAQAERAEAAADNAEVGIRDDTVTKQHLTPELRDELDGKADTGHTHPLDQVDGLADELDGKADTGHTHPLDQVDGLADELDGKADKAHTHPSEHISDATDTGGEGSAEKVVKWNSSGEITRPGGDRPTHWESLVNRRYVDGEVAKKADAGHTHTAAQVGAATPAYVDSRIQLVTSWPASPVAGVLYLMEEG